MVEIPQNSGIQPKINCIKKIFCFVFKILEMDVELASNICPMGASNRPGDIGGNFNLVVCKIRTISPIAVSNETKSHRKKIIELMSIYFNGFGYAD